MKLKRKEVKIMVAVKSNKGKSGCIYIGAPFIGCKTIGKRLKNGIEL